MSIVIVSTLIFFLHFMHSRGEMGGRLLTFGPDFDDIKDKVLGIRRFSYVLQMTTDIAVRKHFVCGAFNTVRVISYRLIRIYACFLFAIFK